MVDKMPPAPKAPSRKSRSVLSDLKAETQDVESPAAPAAPVAEPAAPAAQDAKKKGWDRGGQISVVLGVELRERLKVAQKLNAVTYDSIADLVREAITEKLDKLEK